MALEAALLDRATDAARALGLEGPDVPRAGARVPEDVLRTLLVDLVQAGVVLPDADRFGRGRG